MSRFEDQITVDVPVRVAYDRWTRFEDFPSFMDGVERVEQLDDKTFRWTASVAGVDEDLDRRDHRPDTGYPGGLEERRGRGQRRRRPVRTRWLATRPGSSCASMPSPRARSRRPVMRSASSSAGCVATSNASRTWSSGPAPASTGGGARSTAMRSGRIRRSTVPTSRSSR